jgi:hypothetical protein
MQGLIGGVVVDGLWKFVFDVLKDHIQKTRDRRAELETVEKTQRARVAAEQDLATRASLIKRYPFGEPGRLKAYYRHGKSPCILIGPLRLSAGTTIDIGPEVFDVLSEAPSSLEYYQPIPDPIVSDECVPRLLKQADIIEIAENEFRDQPALLIHFELRTNAVVATAYFWKMFPTTTGERGFATRVARYDLKADRNSPAGRPELTRPKDTLPSFTVINLPETEEDRISVFASTVGLFLAASLDIYWGTHNRNSSLFRRLTQPDGQDEHDHGTLPFLEVRISEEIDRLQQAGFQSQLLQLDREHNGVLVNLASCSVLFLLPPEYPDVPPVVRIHAGARISDFGFEHGSWSPERTLAEVVEAFV